MSQRYAFQYNSQHFTLLFFIFLFVLRQKTFIYFALFSNVRTFALANSDGAIAQLVEHRTENPCVPGSNPGGTTTEETLTILNIRS